MAIAALVVQLEATSLDTTLATLRAWPELTVGDRDGAFLPVVAHTQDAERGRDLFEELRSLPGVRFVDVVMVDLRDEQEVA